MQELFNYMGFNQSDEPGWQETIAGKMCADEGRFEEARHYFERAIKLRRLEWSNVIDHSSSEKTVFTSPLEIFIGNYNDEAEISIRDGSLICKRFNIEKKLIRLLADVLILISSFALVGLFIGISRKLNGHSFFFSTEKTRRETEFIKTADTMELKL